MKGDPLPPEPWAPGERNEIIRTLAAHGVTIGAIGNVFEISRQRVHQIINTEPAETEWLTCKVCGGEFPYPGRGPRAPTCPAHRQTNEWISSRQEVVMVDSELEQQQR